MVHIVGAAGIFMLVIGVVGAVSPRRLIALMTRLQSQQGLWGIAAFRLFLGASFWLAASQTAAPTFARAFGGLLLLSGAITPFFGVHRFKVVVGWFAARAGLMRAWCAVVVPLGAWCVWIAWA